MVSSCENFLGAPSASEKIIQYILLQLEASLAQTFDQKLPLVHFLAFTSWIIRKYISAN